jgi:hypothetical protein
MYEMRRGHGKRGTEVWHVIAPQALVALCGQPLVEETQCAPVDDAPHCAACLTLFAQRMDGRSA